MTVLLNPYLSFRTEARQAMEHYRSVFGGELTVDTFGSSGMTDDPAQADLVMHARLETGTGLVLMASDTPPGMDVQDGSRVSISLSGDDEATLRRFWDGLSEGGVVTMPLEPAPWGDVFGMCTDRFGITWMVNMPGASSGSS